MCGIVAYLDKSGGQAAVGMRLVAMLAALQARGPDSAGVAIWGTPSPGVILRVNTSAVDPAGLAPTLVDVANGFGRVIGHPTNGVLARIEVAAEDPAEMVRAVETSARGIEVVSLGRRLEILKQVGSPDMLEKTFAVSALVGSHGLGHTRLSTESRVDLSHSQPFWAHGTPDLAVVHNGHITNYHRLRRMYEQAGVRFRTENDSEIIGVYLAGKLREGASLEEALAASVRELDGSFSYLVGTADALGFAKDPFCLKPLLMGETGEAIALANEEIALHAALGGSYTAHEAPAGAVAVWKLGELQPQARRADPEMRPSGARGELQPQARRADPEMGPSGARPG
jgi:glutamate synthase domain-containing protein 1